MPDEKPKPKREPIAPCESRPPGPLIPSAGVPPPADRRARRWTSRVARAHIPMRPAWLCRNCAAPWPCNPAQLHLATEFYGHSIALAFYMASNLQDATDDLYALGARPDVRALHLRFLGWLSISRRPRRA